jgi:hypothetical protein
MKEPDACPRLQMRIRECMSHGSVRQVCYYGWRDKLSANWSQFCLWNHPEIIHNRLLEFHKFCVRWVPTQLTILHKQMHFDIWEQHMDHYSNECDAFLESSLVTKHGLIIVSRSKWQSMEWKHSQLLSNKKFKSQPSWCLQLFRTHKAQYWSIIRRGAQ